MHLNMFIKPLFNDVQQSSRHIVLIVHYVNNLTFHQWHKSDLL